MRELENAVERAIVLAKGDTFGVDLLPGVLRASLSEPRREDPRLSRSLADAKGEFKAKLVGLERSNEVALVKVEAKDLPSATLGNSSQVAPGQWVAAIG